MAYEAHVYWKICMNHFVRSNLKIYVFHIVLKIVWPLNTEHGDGLQVLHYAVGQKYEAHYDYFHDNVHILKGGQRMATMLMYLYVALSLSLSHSHTHTNIHKYAHKHVHTQLTAALRSVLRCLVF